MATLNEIRLDIAQLPSGKYSRDQLPQIPQANIKDFILQCKSRGVNVTAVRVLASELKPSQKNLDKNKVKIFLKGTHDDDSLIFISNDKYVVDGHHRWASKLVKGESVKCIKIDLPLEKLIEFCHSCDGTFTKSIHEDLPKPRIWDRPREKCKVKLCKQKESFTCRKCGEPVCANHCTGKHTDWTATCGKCWGGK